MLTAMKKMLILASAIAICGGIGFAVGDPSGTGSHAVSTRSIKIAGVTIPHVAYPVDIWAQVWYPTDLSSGPFPLVLVMHGNHGVCRTPGSTDDFCSTDPPNCPSGFVETPNHLGYNYFTSRLASWGYIVASINANAINCRSFAIDDRGRLIQAHLRRWVGWNSPKGGSPIGTLFSGKVDLSKIALIGHSRGGEGVRAGYDFWRAEGDPTGIDIPAVFEIAPTDFGVPMLFNDFNVNFSVVLPGCDGDVSDNEGMRAFDRAQATPETIFPSPKAQQFVWGACHNFFNSQWSFDDANCFGPDQKPISRTTQQQIGRVYFMGFVRTFIGGEDFKDLFTRDEPPPASVTTIIDNAYAESRGDVLLVDDFTGSRAPSVNKLGGANSLINVTAQACSGPGCSNGANLWLHDPVQHAVELAWPKTTGSPPAFAEALAAKGAPVDISAYKFLSFRVAEQNSTRNPANPGLQDFSVWLKGAKGGVAKVKVSAYKQIHFPVGSGDRKSILATVRIPLTDFAPVDLTHIVEIRYLFDQTSKGAIYLSDIRFSP